jgi:hypothetical protein
LLGLARDSLTRIPCRLGCSCTLSPAGGGSFKYPNPSRVLSNSFILRPGFQRSRRVIALGSFRWILLFRSFHQASHAVEKNRIRRIDRSLCSSLTWSVVSRERKCRLMCSRRQPLFSPPSGFVFGPETHRFLNPAIPSARTEEVSETASGRQPLFFIPFWEPCGSLLKS